MTRFEKLLAIAAGSAALSLPGAAAVAQQTMDCAVISFERDGAMGANGSARLQRGVSATPGMRGTIQLAGEPEAPVTGAWEADAAVLYFADERLPFNGREYDGRPGSNERILAGRVGATPVYFYCRPAPGGVAPPPPPPPPPPRPDPEPEPVLPGGRDEASFAGAIDIRLGQFADLDAPTVLDVFAEGVDLAMADAREGTTFFTVGETRLGDPFGFSSMSLEQRCRNARERGRLDSGGVPALTLRRGEEVCFETPGGAFGALVVRSANPREAAFDVHRFD